mgnify:CR=1 FL=1
MLIRSFALTIIRLLRDGIESFGSFNRGRQKWPLIPTEQRDMRLAGDWKGLIPSPVTENTYFFKDIDQLSDIYSLILTPGTYGYVVYPYKMEERFKLSENETAEKIHHCQRFYEYPCF